MAAATKVVEQFGKIHNPQQVAQTMQQFQKENSKMEMGAEMIGDAIDECFDSAGVEEEADELVDQVLDEIGVDTAARLQSAPRKDLSAGRQSAEEVEFAADDLVARLAQLKG